MQVIPDVLSIIFEGGFNGKEFKQAGCLRCDGMADFVDAGLAGDVVDEFKSAPRIGCLSIFAS